MKFSKKASVILMILLVFFIVGGITGAYYLGKSGLTISFNRPNIIQQIPPLANQQEVATTRMPEVNESLFSGKLTRLQNDLGLFKFSEADIANGIDKGIVYYEAGTYRRGNYKNYKRIVAVRSPEGPGPATVYILATADNKTYVLNDDTGDTKKYPETDYANPFSFFNRNVVISADVLDTEQPFTISLNNQFALYRNFVPTESVQTTKIDSYNQPVYEYQIQTDFTNYSSLNSTLKFLLLRARPFEKNPYTQNLTPEEKEKESVKEQYVAGSTEVIAVDEAGLPFSYNLTTPSRIASYRAEKETYDAALRKYQEGVEKKLTPAPSYPATYPESPNLRITKANIVTRENLYQNYSVSIPQACGMDTNTLTIKNISDRDLKNIGSGNGFDFYLLSDKTHKLYQLAYNNKIKDVPPEMWNSVNENVTRPTFDEYVAKNPLLFMKDYWGRWVMLGEYDYRLQGGCGKPVIYLYPEKPTEVSVKFENKMNFDVSIPTYVNDGWKVLAAPDGSLKDLQPELTNCSKLNFLRKGSEYAKTACHNNSYPYLYWAGNTLVKYPKVEGGWVVAKNNLEIFLNQKLDEVGFNKQEKTDMFSYWLPFMQNKNAPWYRVSFLQTRQLNQFIPMMINPTPTHIFRLFLDWEPLVSKPTEILPPQTLEHVNREGFTVVEWGGLKR